MSRIMDKQRNIGIRQDPYKITPLGSEDNPGDWHGFVREIEDLEHKAHCYGYTQTAHALNAAKNKAGWEHAEKLGKLKKALTS